MQQSVNEIAVMLDENISTIGVKFLDVNGTTIGSREYTYLTKLNHEIDDYVVVQANGRFAICKVTRVDGEVPLIDDKYQYQFIVQKVDTTEHLKNQAEYISTTIEVRRLVQKSRRQSIKDQIINGNEELRKLCKTKSNTIELNE